MSYKYAATIENHRDHPMTFCIAVAEMAHAKKPQPLKLLT